MTSAERIAFAMFKSGYPPHIADAMKIESLGVIQTPLENGFVGEIDVALDWEFNRETYIRNASAALAEIEKILEERRKP